ncbi:major facilitator superfamily domain-containing protein 6-like, partial [Oppia nitens]|uniref:major facilitator superfamily domain-containing protein 6-like n=1 Tax=Oppia nitens TaxID=1686743 RepID=UPI0023DC8CB1
MSILKAHYLLWFGSLSGIMPFVTVFATAHTIATYEDIGLLYFVLPFLVAIIKPLFCSIADRNGSHKKILLLFIIVTIIGYSLLLLIIYIKLGVISWILLCLLILLANTGQGVVISLNDYICMKEVTELNKSYGQYRVWGTVGWGTGGVIAGLINEYITQMPYLLPGLLMFIVIEGTDLMLMYFKFKSITNQSEDNNSEIVATFEPKHKPLVTILKKPFIATAKSTRHVFHLFRHNPSIMQYIVIILITGALTAFHWSYYFAYIEKIRGKDTLLMGLALFVESFAGELPIFIIANIILNYCGPSISLNISLGAFAFRYFIYGFVINYGNTYWDVLLIEVTQGLTFGLFYTVMTDLAQHYANQENERLRKVREQLNVENRDDKDVCIAKAGDYEPRSYATMQAIMSAAFEGIGLGIGALMGGYLIQIDTFLIWKVGAFLACFGILFNIVVDSLKYLYN